MPILKGLSYQILNELTQFGDLISPQIEKYLFGSYSHFDNIRFYKSVVSNKEPFSSWKWHFDNNPKEQIRILVYLNDVLNEGDGQFEYYYDPVNVNENNTNYLYTAGR